MAIDFLVYYPIQPDAVNAGLQLTGKAESPGFSLSTARECPPNPNFKPHIQTGCIYTLIFTIRTKGICDIFL